MIASIILMLLLGCSDKKVQIPEDILSKNKMVDVLIDIHLLESKIKKLYIAGDSSSKLYNHYEKMLFEDHGIKRKEYEKSLEFYVQEIEQLEDIYEQVVDSLMVRDKTQHID